MLGLEGDCVLGAARGGSRSAVSCARATDMHMEWETVRAARETTAHAAKRGRVALSLEWKG